MMQIAYGAQARAKLLSGADRLADAVQDSLGPKDETGRSIKRRIHKVPPLPTGQSRGHRC